MVTIKASDARNNWSETYDTVVRKKPVIINRTRDYALMISREHILKAFGAYKFRPYVVSTDSEEVSIWCEELGLYGIGVTEEEAKNDLLNEIVEYSKEYFDNFEQYSADPNRCNHIPYILKVVFAEDEKKLEGDIVWQLGKTSNAM